MIFTNRKAFDEFKAAHDKESCVVEAMLAALESDTLDMSLLMKLAEQLDQVQAEKLAAQHKALDAPQ
jgi:hypothetical protein